ncbi:MAG: manganese/iron transport system ATP-binding protein, partial [Patiriisocius sp.]
MPDRVKPVDTAAMQINDAGAGITVNDVTVTYRNGHTALYDATFEVPLG